MSKGFKGQMGRKALKDGVEMPHLEREDEQPPNTAEVVRV